MKDEEPISNCCNAHFTNPGWPDSDLCSKCFEHADIQEEEDSDDYYKDFPRIGLYKQMCLKCKDKEKE